MLDGPTAYAAISSWLNANQGVVEVGVFLSALMLGWMSGLFAAIRRRPRFRISVLRGPTYCCTFHSGGSHNGSEIHRTGIALYLSIANIGSAASSIEQVSVAYHWNLHPFSWQWLRYAVGWFWLREQATALKDFQVAIGTSIKVYPFLFQRSSLSDAKSSTYLEVGATTQGVVYFEQADSWGGCFPASKDELVSIKIEVLDTFGGRHRVRALIPMVTLENARRYNPSFGKTLSELRGEVLPHDRI